MSNTGDLDPPHAEHPSLARIGAFSDGVFAFAITLLVLAIRIPRPGDPDADRGLVALLADQWRVYVAYVLSFMLVGINWTNHRVMWSKFARADNTLVWLNLLYLMVSTALIPVLAAILGAWLGEPGNEVAAVVIYGAMTTAGTVCFNLMWWHGAFRARLTSATLTPESRHAHTVAWAISIPVSAAVTAVGMFAPGLAVAGFVAIVLAYVLPLATVVAYFTRRGRTERSANVT